ncbi:MAG TPA: HD-GYP domain-containing protein [Gammaproteobacteria bacterium]
MSKRKVGVADLQFGMYVTELDRPWVGSPFMFQGFHIRSAEDLEKLHRVCKFVYIEDADEPDADARTIRLSVNARPGANPHRSRSEWQRIASEERRVTFQREFRRVAAVRAGTRRYVQKLLTDVRFGRAVDTEAAKQVVTEMVDRITADPDTALWLTQLRNMHEYTAQHCVNVSVLAITFAAHLGYSREQMQLIGLGALFHDIGKMRVPPQILDKPGPLTPKEFEIMKRHPLDGYEILKATGQVPEQVLQIVRYHHERISGRGYPDGLRGDQISTAVLIVAICDVYDALTSDRAYHHGISADKGLHAMYQLSAENFGRELVQEFIKCIGIYPVGSVVELGTGALGVVMTKDPLNKLQPVVMLVRDSHGREYQPRRFVSLAGQATLDRKNDWRVRRVMEPKDCDMDMQRLAADELLRGGHQVVHV